MARLSAFGADVDAGFGGPQRKGYLQIIVGTHPTYEDGDIKSAVNWTQVRRFTADGLCHWKNAPKTNGIRSFSHHARQFQEIVCQFKFERTAENTLRKTQLSDSQFVDITSGQPFTDIGGKTAQMEVAEFVARRLNHDRHRIFGTPGAEIWYGGRTTADDAVLDAAWAMIEAETGILEVDLQEAPFSDHRKYLTISVNNFDDNMGGQLTSPLLDETDPENPITVKKRKSLIQWRDLRDVIEADVLDRQKLVRIDGIRKHARQEILQEKTV